MCTLGQIWPGPAVGWPVLRLAAHDQWSRGALMVALAGGTDQF
jgi:hypothetical protein